MPTLFTRIIDGELPGRFVWRDEGLVAFLSIAPLSPGHALVVPRQEIDSWLDAEPNMLARCMDVAQRIGRAAATAWDAPRAGLIIAGFEVDHLHLHVFPAWGMDDLDFHRVDAHPDPAALDEAAETLRAALRAQGDGAHVPD